MAATGAESRSDQSESARRWWPGRADEVRRVADRLRAFGLPDGSTTVGEMARRTRSDVFIVDDALAMNDEVAAVLAFDEAEHGA